MSQPSSFSRFALKAWSRRHSLIGALLVGALLITQPALAQGPSLPESPGATASSDAPQTLHIVILEGDEALNNIRDRTAREPIVQVEDENHKPVAGALVLFTLHGGTSGAGGSFAGGLGSLSVTTGVNGQARALGLQSNQVSGSFTITVKATLGTLTSEAVITQTNAAEGSNGNEQNSTASTVRRISTKKSWLIAAGAGGVLAVVIFFGARTSATSITAGAGSVGH